MALTHATHLIGTHLVMLHGANGCRQELAPWAQALSADFKVHMLNLTGHGGTPFPPEFDMATFTADLVAQLDEAGIERAVIFGYSFGGLVALHLASYLPDRVQGVITLATKFVYDTTAIEHVAHLLQVSRLMGMAARRELATRLRGMFLSFADQSPLSVTDLALIDCPVLILSGTHDQIVSAEECRALQQAIGHAGLALFNGQAHPASRVPTEGLAQVVRGWAKHALPRCATFQPDSTQGLPTQGY